MHELDIHESDPNFDVSDARRPSGGLSGAYEFSACKSDDPRRLGRRTMVTCVSGYCAGNITGVMDAQTLEPARGLPSIGVAPEASGDALIWYTVVPGGRTVTLFQPR